MTFTQKAFIDESLACALTGHSERGTFQSLLAGVGVPKAERQYLGRWSASGADEYVRTYKLMVKRLLGRMGDIVSSKNLFSTVDEAEAYESLKELAEKKLNDPAGGQARLAQLRLRCLRAMVLHSFPFQSALA